MAYGVLLKTESGLQNIENITNGLLISSYRVVNNDGNPLDVTGSYIKDTTIPFPTSLQPNEARFSFVKAHDNRLPPTVFVEETIDGFIRYRWEWFGYEGPYNDIYGASYDFEVFFVRIYQGSTITPGTEINFPEIFTVLMTDVWYFVGNVIVYGSQAGYNIVIGAPGAYGFQKYSNDGGITFTPNNGDDLGIWTGIYWGPSSTPPTNTSEYTWTEIDWLEPL